MKNIFITGASSGIGRATAMMLAERGHQVWGTSRNVERLSKMDRFHPIQLDLAQADSIEGVFRTALADAGHFDVVINNAGSGHFGCGENLSEKEITAQFQILVFAQLQLMRLALREMRTRGNGLVINVTSLASRLPVPFMATYNAAKAAMASFTMSLQLELENSRIRVVDLQPGDICTPFNDAVVKGEKDTPYQGRLAKTWEAIERNMANAPKPDLVAAKILELIGDDNPPPRVTVGDAFQTKLAPFIFRFLPQRLRIWGLKKYYGI